VTEPRDDDTDETVELEDDEAVTDDDLPPLEPIPGVKTP